MPDEVEKTEEDLRRDRSWLQRTQDLCDRHHNLSRLRRSPDRRRDLSRLRCALKIAKSSSQSHV